MPIRKKVTTRTIPTTQTIRCLKMTRCCLKVTKGYSAKTHCLRTIATIAMTHCSQNFLTSNYFPSWMIRWNSMVTIRCLKTIRSTMTQTTRWTAMTRMIHSTTKAKIQSCCSGCFQNYCCSGCFRTIRTTRCYMMTRSTMTTPTMTTPTIPSCWNLARTRWNCSTGSYRYSRCYRTILTSRLILTSNCFPTNCSATTQTNWKVTIAS